MIPAGKRVGGAGSEIPREFVAGMAGMRVSQHWKCERGQGEEAGQSHRSKKSSSYANPQTHDVRETGMNLMKGRALFRVLGGDELFPHGFRQQLGRQQALADKEVIKCLPVELGSEGDFGGAA